MTTDDNTNERGIGDNNPPEPIDFSTINVGAVVLAEPVDKKLIDGMENLVSRFLGTARDLVARKAELTEEDGEKINDVIAAIRQAEKQINEKRLEVTRPYDAAKRKVSKLFDPSLTKLDRAKKTLTPILNDILRAKEKRLAAEKAEKERAAAAEREAAESALAEAREKGDIGAEVDAEAAIKEAAKQAKAASRPVRAAVGSASGGAKSVGLRTTRSAKITNPRALALHYIEQNNPKFMELLQSLANADVRAKDVDHSKIPGIEEVLS